VVVRWRSGMGRRRSGRAGIIRERGKGVQGNGGIVVVLYANYRDLGDVQVIRRHEV
jgi:hypothetical protein